MNGMIDTRPGRPNLQVVRDTDGIEIPTPPADAVQVRSTAPRHNLPDRNHEMRIAHVVINVAAIGVMILVIGVGLGLAFWNCL